MRNIDYGLLDKAQHYYSEYNFINTTTPWKIPASMCEKVSGHRKEFIGSAEQSLYYLYSVGKLFNQKYQSITPCFRYDDPIDETHIHEFMKLELIHFGEKDPLTILGPAQNFLNSLGLQSKIIETDLGFDLEINDIEVGSYYHKNIDGCDYVCGTGIALPRLQVAAKLGYSNTIIQRGVVGYTSKIREEVDEYIDAIKQGNPIMALVELSDVLLAMDKYVNKFNLSIEDLIKMAQATKQSFVDGCRV